MYIRVKIAKILKICNPYETRVWECDVTIEDVQKALDNGDFVPDPHNGDPNTVVHAGRIAYLVLNGWDDAIQIDVGIPAMACHVDWPIIDGNHRLCAAIFREDETVLCSIAGDLDYAAEILDFDAAEIDRVFNTT